MGFFCFVSASSAPPHPVPCTAVLTKRETEECGQRLGGTVPVQMGFNCSGLSPETVTTLLLLLLLLTWERNAGAVGVKLSTLLKKHVGVNAIQLIAIWGVEFLITWATT